MDELGLMALEEMERRLNANEAEIARLRAGLTMIIEELTGPHSVPNTALTLARAALKV